MLKIQQGWNEFTDLLLSAKDKDEFYLLLDLFLTDEEKSDLAARFLIVRELIKQEKTQRVIASELHVSIAKITRGSNELKRASRKLLMYLKSKLVR